MELKLQYTALATQIIFVSIINWDLVITIKKCQPCI